jgi:carbonic anhydrase/acetyltransferase-like protein (isoleucine patch superfamily)
MIYEFDGFRPVVHGARICRNALIGMNRVILDNATIAPNNR